MRIPQVPVFTTLVFLLGASIIALWVRSSKYTHVLLFYTPAGHLTGFASDRTGLLICATQIPFGPEMRVSAETMSVSSDEFAAVHDLLFDSSNLGKDGPRPQYPLPLLAAAPLRRFTHRANRVCHSLPPETESSRPPLSTITIAAL